MSSINMSKVPIVVILPALILKAPTKERAVHIHFLKPKNKKGNDNSVEVEVEYATFMGDFTRVLVTMMDGKRLVVKEERMVASEFHNGDQYHLIFPTDKTHIFHEGVRAR